MTSFEGRGFTDLPEFAVRPAGASLMTSGDSVHIDVNGRTSTVPEILKRGVLNLWPTAYGVFRISDVAEGSSGRGNSSVRLTLTYLLRIGALESISAALATRQDSTLLIGAAEDAGLLPLQNAERIADLTIVVAGEDRLTASIVGAAEELGVGSARVEADQTDDGLRSAIRDAGAIIVATPALASSLVARLNEICHELSVPLVPVVAGALACSVGPSVLPSQSPCTACYLSRIGSPVISDAESSAFPASIQQS